MLLPSEMNRQCALSGEELVTGSTEPRLVLESGGLLLLEVSVGVGFRLAGIFLIAFFRGFASLEIEGSGVCALDSDIGFVLDILLSLLHLKVMSFKLLGSKVEIAIDTFTQRIV